MEALGDDDEELVWACKTKQMCAQKKEKRVYLAPRAKRNFGRQLATKRFCWSRASPESCCPT